MHTEVRRLYRGANASSLADHTCAAEITGSASCWGANESGQMGSGSTLPIQSQAESVESVSTAVRLTAGAHHSCSVEETGYLRCWGANDFGQLGTGGFTSSTVPLRITGAGLAEDVSAGGEHTCALTREALIMCWGRNRLGQLGTGSRTDIPVPTPIIWP